jgi:hypothetical protein
MVIFEAARAVTQLKDVTSRELTPAITVLQLFLSSSKPVLRFAAVRTLNKVAMTHPLAVTNCNIDMESLIADQNRSIATLAITTLLKTGNESSVDRLMKQITNFMSDIADEFKIVVVEAIRSLCLKFPQKYRTLMSFLSNILREEGGFEYKKAIVDSILILINEIPEAKEGGLAHLCEFIEDCEFTYLSTQVSSMPPCLALYVVAIQKELGWTCSLWQKVTLFVSILLIFFSSGRFCICWEVRGQRLQILASISAISTTVSFWKMPLYGPVQLVLWPSLELLWRL